MIRFLLICLAAATCNVSHCADTRFMDIQFVGAESAAQAATTSSRAWRTSHGAWAYEQGTVSAAGDFDNRAINPAEQPEALRWPVTIDLQEGWSAAALVWCDGAGEKGYAVRLDSRENNLALERIGAWPQVEELDYFPWSFIDGKKVSLVIETGENFIRVFAPEVSPYALLEALNVEPEGQHVGFQILDSKAAFSDTAPEAGKPGRSLKSHKPVVGEFAHVYNPSIGESSPWYINDHTFARTENGWHMVGITHAQPAAPLDELNFAHAISPEFPGRLDTWKKMPYALETDPARGEAHLWAPHIFKRDKTYYMFYCAGSPKGGAHYQISLATSEDCTSWTRHPHNPIFQDTFDARDPMILEDNGTYLMYYTANMGRNESHHTVNLRTSKDLINWGPARIVFKHKAKGTWGGETESPYVVKHEDHFYR